MVVVVVVDLWWRRRWWRRHNARLLRDRSFFASRIYSFSACLLKIFFFSFLFFCRIAALAQLSDHPLLRLNVSESTIYHCWWSTGTARSVSDCRSHELGCSSGRRDRRPSIYCLRTCIFARYNREGLFSALCNDLFLFNFFRILIFFALSYCDTSRKISYRNLVLTFSKIRSPARWTKRSTNYRSHFFYTLLEGIYIEFTR